MKKFYKKPLAVNHDVEKNVFPALAGALGAVAGYSIGRAVATSMKAAPVIKLKQLGR